MSCIFQKTATKNSTSCYCKFCSSGVSVSFRVQKEDVYLHPDPECWTKLIAAWLALDLIMKGAI